MDKEPVNAGGDTPSRFRVVTQWPCERVVFAGYQRHIWRNYSSRGTPGSEHVGVDEVGGLQSGLNPAGELLVDGPLPRRVSDLIVQSERVDVEPEVPRQRDAGQRRVAC
jgi:hypothetical protein